MLIPSACCFGEELFLREKKLNGSILYTLGEKGEGGIDLWKETVNVPSDGKPMDRWCRLVASDKNHDGAIALIENNQVQITLLQFDRENKPLSVIKIFDPGWLRSERIGAKLSASAPNRIILSFRNQERQTWSVVDGILIDESGNVYKQEKTLQIGSLGSEVARQSLTTNTVPAAVSNTVPPALTGKVPQKTKPTVSSPSEEPVSSTQWSIIVMLMVAAIGLLWLLLKGRE